MSSELLKNIKLVIAYDGTAYLGWQKTPTGPSIEKTLQTVLEQILQHPIRLQAASRTDAGVHAKGQVVNFQTPRLIDLKRLQISLCSLLPKDIAVMEASDAPETFHPTLDCIAKEYHYAICYGKAQWPQDRFYEWHYPHFLSIVEMRRGLPLLIGEQDFSAFCNVKKNESYVHHRRLVSDIAIEELEAEKILIKIKGGNFLYKMVRNIVGTLAYIGRGKIAVDDLCHLIAQGDRRETGVTAPAHGLTLVKCFYASSHPNGV